MIEHEVQDSDNSKEDEDLLDIKPPQTSNTTSGFHHKEKKKRKHSKAHKSSKRNHHQSHNDRIGHRDKKSWKSVSMKKSQKMESRSIFYKDETRRDQIKEFKKCTDETADVRHIRLIDEVRETRLDARIQKHKEGRHLLEEKMEEWRKKRLLWIKHQRELDTDHFEKLHQGNQFEQELQEKLEEKESHMDCPKKQNTSHTNMKNDDNISGKKEETRTVEGKSAPITAKESSSSKVIDRSSSKLPPYFPAIQGSRSVEEFDVLNRIEEGTYGVVYRAKDKTTNEIVALKRLKMEREKEGFPITSLREINTLLKAQHPNIVTVREIVVGSNMDRIYIVMDYVEHDLKSLMKTMPRPFLIGEVKTLLMQLLCAVAHLHDNWILHRDLKTSNLLLSHKGILKVGDFGLAREYGSPLKSYTPVVVTLWYRAPELLLGTKQYSTPIDLWSVGCIFGELLTMNALFPGKSEADQINRIFKDLGTPSDRIWPGYSELPLVKSLHITQYPYNNLKSRFSYTFTDLGFDLLNRFLTYNPSRRITAEKAKNHGFFSEKPKPVSPNMFPTWPAKSELGHKSIKAAQISPKAPSGGKQYAGQMGEADDGLMTAVDIHTSEIQHKLSDKSSGFSLKF